MTSGDVELPVRRGRVAPFVALAVAFGVAKVPETWIIDPNGLVRGRIISRVTADFLSSQLQLLRERIG